MASAQTQLEMWSRFWKEVCASPTPTGAESRVTLVTESRAAAAVLPPRPSAPSLAPPPQARHFLDGLDALVLRRAGLAERAVMLAGRAARGHTTVPSVPWTRVTCVSAAGAQLRASLRLASALSPAAASVFNRHKAALSAGGELALPFTTDKIVGFLAVYCERWGQKSSSLKSVVQLLREFAVHFGIPWLHADDDAAVNEARQHIELANPCDIAHAVSVMDDKVERMLRALDKCTTAGNLWALSLAALITVAHDASTRTNEPTHALRRDLIVSDKGLYLMRYFDKGNKRFQDKRTQTSRASARPGSPLCAVARVRAYLSHAKLHADDLLFPRRDPTSGEVVLDASGKASRYSEYYYLKDFRALAAAAGIEGASTLSPRGLRSGGAMDDRLAGLEPEALNSKVGWGAKKKAQPLYVRGNEIGLELDNAARSTTQRSGTR